MSYPLSFEATEYDLQLDDCVTLSGLAMPCCGFGWERRAEEASAGEVCDAFGPFIEQALATFEAERAGLFAGNARRFYRLGSD